MTGRDTPRLHLVTDDAVLHRPDFVTLACALMERGGQGIALHLRGPRSSGAFLHGLACALGPVARGTKAALLVNDRVDVALSTGPGSNETVAKGTGGAHLAARSIGVAEARRLLGSKALIGVSTHTHDDVREAVAGGADYVFVGAIFGTPSHPGQPGRGTQAISETLTEAMGPMPESSVPVIAIGGIDVARTAEVLAAGAHGVAVIRGVWEAPHPTNALIRYLDALD